MHEDQFVSRKENVHFGQQQKKDQSLAHQYHFSWSAAHRVSLLFSDWFDIPLTLLILFLIRVRVFHCDSLINATYRQLFDFAPQIKVSF